jgi:hypothetical protein
VKEEEDGIIKHKRHQKKEKSSEKDKDSTD